MRPSLTVRRTLRWALAGLLRAAGQTDLARRRLRERGAVIVLALHRVLEDGELECTNSLPGIVLRSITFRRLAEWIALRCQAADLGREPSGPVPGSLRVALTFDDGWEDTYSAALPIAQAFGLPMTVFVCPGLLAQDSPFWPERLAAAIRAHRPAATVTEVESAVDLLKLRGAAEREAMLAAEGATCPAGPGDRTLSWEQIAVMRRGGVTFGAHTQTHQILTAVEPGVAEWEVRESKAALEAALGGECLLFAYPNGDHSAATRPLLEEAGFTRAFTIARGAWVEASDALAIPRVNLAEDDVAGPTGIFSPAMFEYEVFWKPWRAARAGWSRS